MDRYLTSVLRQETQAGPGGRLSFSLEGERTSQICRLRFISLSFSLSVSLCATSLQHHTVVCNSLNCHYPSPTQRGLKEPVLKATHTLKRGRISLCEKKMCERVDVCVCLSYLMSSVEEGWDASLCCRSLDPCNTRELSLNVRSTCPFMYTNKMSELCMSM